MAGVNRYTNTSTAKYDPMSLEELMVVPGLKRQQHDQLNNNVANTRAALAQADYMDMHGEKVSGVKNKLEDELARQVNEVSSNGISQTLKSDFMNLHANYQAETGPKGTLGAAKIAKDTYNAEMQTYIANATKEGYSPAQSKVNWDNHVKNNYTGFDEEGRITNVQGLYAPKYFDVADEVLNLAKVAGVSESDISNLNSNIVLDDDGQYILNTGSRTINANNSKQLTALVNHMNNQIMNPNSGLRQSLDHQGLTPQDAVQMVSGLAPILLKNKTGQENSKTITGFKSSAELGISSTSGIGLNYESTEAESIKIKHSDAVSALLDISEGNPAPGQPNAENVKSTIAGMGPGKFADGATAEPEASTMINRFGQDKRDELAVVFDRLKRTNPNLKGKTFNSREGAQALGEYLQNNQNILRQNIIITDDFMTVYGENSIGTEKSTKNKIEEGVFANIENRKFAIDGEVVTFDQLPESVKLDYEKKLRYGGYGSPKNFLARQYNAEEKDKNMFGSPLKFSMQDDEGNLKTIYVSRSTGEMETPGYQADLIFNDVFTNTNEYPDIPYVIDTQDGPTEVTFNPRTKSYTLTLDPVISGYKEPMQLTESQLQSIFYESMGVEHPNSKKK